MEQLSRYDYRTALSLVARLEKLSAGPTGWLRSAMEAVTSFVACESAEFVMLQGAPGANAIRPDQHRGRAVAALTLEVQEERQFCLVLLRRRAPFTSRDRARLGLLQPHLAFLYAQASRLGGDSGAAPDRSETHAPSGSDAGLTRREEDVMRWLSFGKTDAEIAALLSISPRTVHKHLEHIYEKLGVETRTTAVMAARRRATRIGP